MEGWVFDVNEVDNGIICWIKQKNASAKPVFFDFHPSFYILVPKINKSLRLLENHDCISEVKKIERKITVLEKNKTVIKVSSSSRENLMKVFEDSHSLLDSPRYFNLHIPPALQFLYSTGLFPTASIKLILSNNYLVTSYNLLDSKNAINYSIPPLKKTILDIEDLDARKVYRDNTPIKKIILKDQDNHEKVVLDGKESTILYDLNNYLANSDPDILITHGGDDLIFPYLALRSKINNVPLFLSRTKKTIKILQTKPDAYATYFSYGKIYNKPLTEYILEGRLHLDKTNSFLFPSCGLEGLIEVSRMCSIPLQRCSRMTIGQAMSSAQYCEAHRRGVLVPYKSENAEEFKSAFQLLKEDKGGFVFQPKVGLYENVFECDFESMYPNIMVTRNVSPETLTQIPKTGYNQVPGTHFYIISDPKGIVPSSIKKILAKRHRYKKEKSHSIAFDQRQKALKWILVTSFGFLGFHNAKFGSVEAHMAVTAYAREILLNSANLAFQRGWEILHGIVDCLWIKSDNSMKQKEVDDFCREVKAQTKIPLNLEGIYDWIVFLPTKRNPSIGALTRYYGKMKNGKIKVRGIELRRRDTPLLIKKAQDEFIKILSKARSKKEFIDLIPKCREVVKNYETLIMKGNINIEELYLHIHISREMPQYRVANASLIALKQLERAGIQVHPGQNINFIYSNSKAKNPMRRITVDALANNRGKLLYDKEKYVELVNRAYNNLFGGIEYKTKKNTLFDFMS